MLYVYNKKIFVNIKCTSRQQRSNMTNFVWIERVRNLVGKGENADNGDNATIFSFSHNGFKYLLSRVGVQRGSVVKCLTCNPRVLGSRHSGLLFFFRGSVLGQDTSEPQSSTGERHE